MVEYHSPSDHGVLGETSWDSQQKYDAYFLSVMGQYMCSACLGKGNMHSHFLFVMGSMKLPRKVGETHNLWVMIG